MKYTNRTQTPVEVGSLVDKFSTNETTNCPIVPGSLEIAKVFEANTGQEVHQTFYAALFEIVNDVFSIKSTSTIGSWIVHIKAANQLIEGGDTNPLISIQIDPYENKPPYFMTTPSDLRVDIYEGEEEGKTFTFLLP